MAPRDIFASFLTVHKAIEKMVFSFTSLHLGYQQCATKCSMEFEMCRRSKYDTPQSHLMIWMLLLTSIPFSARDGY
jgi:hypothetical protein